MEEKILILGLPVETLVIVGGLYFLATFLPTIISLILGHKEDKKIK